LPSNTNTGTQISLSPRRISLSPRSLSPRPLWGWGWLWRRGRGWRPLLEHGARGDPQQVDNPPLHDVDRSGSLLSGTGSLSLRASFADRCSSSTAFLRISRYEPPAAAADAARARALQRPRRSMERRGAVAGDTDAALGL
ncbi:unnamed protein product, partial [Urochloa humidicola]